MQGIEKINTALSSQSDAGVNANKENIRLLDRPKRE